MTDNRTNEPTRAQVEAAARKWIERLDSDAHWARSPGAREKASSEKKILEWLLEAAAGAAPQAESECRSRTPKRLIGQLKRLADALEEYEFEDAANDAPAWMRKAAEHLELTHKPAVTVQPSNTVDEAALAEVIESSAAEWGDSARVNSVLAQYIARAVAEYLTGGTK